MTAVEPVRPIDHLSFSSGEDYCDCPKKWHAKYVLGVEDPSGPEAHVGTMAHDVLELLGRFPPGRRTVEVAHHLARRLWANDPADMRRDAWAHVTRALRLLEVAAGDVVYCEEKLSVVLAGVPFTGRLDRADALPSGALIVIDYKTGKRNAGRNNVYLLPKFRQLALYAAAIEAIHGRPVRHGMLVWTVNGKTDPIDLDDVELAEALRWLRETWASIQGALTNDDFPADPGNLCPWCPIVAECDEGTAVVLERYAAGKTIGVRGQAIIDAKVTDDLERSVAVANGEHLTAVPDLTEPF